MEKTMARDPSSWGLQTKLIRGGVKRSELGETAEAIFTTSGFRYDRAEIAEARFAGKAEGFTYSRLSNPSVAMFEERMALIEGAPVARATATGMAAVSAALLCQLSAGDHLVAARALFGSCRYIIEELLPRYGVSTTLVDGTDNAAWERAITAQTSAVFLETPANPTLEITDLVHVCGLAHAAGARVVIDNVFATPILQKPREMGADVVVYSATKHIDGQGRVMGGCILCDEDFFTDHLNQFLRHTGPTLSPFNAWVLYKGLETLELRITRMCATAAVLADYLAQKPALARVLYPGRKDHPQHGLAMKQMSAGGSVITFDVPGGREQAFALLDSLELIDISNNLGDAKTLITHPASTTHQRLSLEEREQVGIGAGTVRLSVGLENAEDLIDDLEQACAKASL